MKKNDSSSKGKAFCIKGKVLTEKGFQRDTSLVVKDGLVQELSPAPKRDSGVVFDYPSMYVVPGFVEMHVHGALGCDFANGRVEENSKIAKYLAKQGVTALMAALVSSPESETKRASKALAETPKQGAKILGALFEGPFINPERKGAHRAECLRLPELDLARNLIDVLPTEMIKAMLIAPELDGALPFISAMAKEKVILAMGHSSADYSTSIEALDRGVRYGVHLFNAMAPLHHRKPGIVGALLSRDDAFVEVIPDFLHLHPAIVDVIISAKGSDRVALVTDSTGPAGLKEGCYDWSGLQVELKGGEIRLHDGTLAGSSLGNQQILQGMKSLGFSLEEIVKMRSSVPAKILGLEKDYGRIAEGSPANITVLDEDCLAVATIVDGQFVYQR